MTPTVLVVAATILFALVATMAGAARRRRGQPRWQAANAAMAVFLMQELAFLGLLLVDLDGRLALMGAVALGAAAIGHVPRPLVSPADPTAPRLSTAMRHSPGF